MLSPTELRIGNCVKDHTGAIRFISHRRLSDIASNPDSHGYEPIPLTPEILEACGFTRPELSRVYKLPIKYIDENYPCTLQETGDGIQICRSGIGAITAPIKHVHQLQNLYYALTGSELRVNLKEKV